MGAVGGAFAGSPPVAVNTETGAKLRWLASPEGRREGLRRIAG
ncbi:hypothetical protein [Streptomyces sp. 184]